MKTLSIIITLLTLTIVSNTFISTAQTPIKPVCLKLADSTAFGLVNRDSVYIDTCQNSPTYNLIFAYRGYVRFKVKATHLPYYPDSTILDTNWTIIDTAYPQLRSVFQSIDTTIGHFILQKIDPADTSNSFFSQRYTVLFNSYTPCDKVDSLMETIPDSLLIWGWFRTFIRFDNAVIEAEPNTTNYFKISNSLNTITVTTNSHNNFGRIVSLLGNTLQTFSLVRTTNNQSQATIDISNLPSGIYFIVCGNGCAPFVKGD